MKIAFRFALMAVMLISSVCGYAQTDEELIAAAVKVDRSNYSFSYNIREVDGLRYKFDDTNNLACFTYFSDYNVAPETLTIPEIVEYNGKKYVVVKTEYSNYTQNTTKKINLPSSLCVLGESTFNGYTNVQEVVIPENVRYIEKGAFYGFNYKTAIFTRKTPAECGGALMNYTGNDYNMKLIVPKDAFLTYIVEDYYEDQCVICEDYAKSEFHTGKVDNGELGYVVVANQLPQVVTYSMVNRLIVDEGTIDETDWYQLRQMKNLVYLDLSGLSIEEIPAEALYNCWQIETVILPPTVKTIKGYAFRHTGLRNITLPDGLENITGSYNFYNCYQLEGLSIPDGVKSLPHRFAEDCPKFTWLKLPAYLETMGTYAFNYCDIRRLYIPGTLRVLPDHAFSYNKNLYKLDLGNGIERIEDYVFSECNTLGDQSLWEEGEYKEGTPCLTFPPSMRYIGGNAFNNCKSLKSIALNEGLEEIYYYTFNNCTGLTEVTLPSSLLYARYTPFYGCSNLMDIYCMSLLPPTVENSVITSNAGNRNLHVPLFSFQEYMTTPGWLEYQDHTIVDPNILPENIYINKDFEFVLTEELNNQGYHPNIRLFDNKDRIDDGFGNQKYQRGNLTISSRSFLDANDFETIYSPYAKYFADESHWRSSSNDYNYDYYSTKFNPTSLVVKGRKVEVSSLYPYGIAPTMRSETQTINLYLANNYWAFICFPFDVKMEDIKPCDAKTQWVVRYYDGAARAAGDFDNTWKNLTSTDILEAGKGYIMKAYNEDFDGYYVDSKDPVQFTVTPVTESVNRQALFRASNYDVALQINESEYEQNRSWNLIGNPYPCYYDTRYIDADIAFLVRDSYNGTYKAFSTADDDYILNPGEAFFIQAGVDQTGLRFLEGGRQTYRNPNDLTVQEGDGNISTLPAKRSSALNRDNSSRKVYNIAISNGDIADQTRVVLNEEATTQYETGRDAAKMMSDDAKIQIWTVNNGVSYAINERPERTGLVPMSISCKEAGMYTIQLTGKNGQDEVYVEDKEMGITSRITAEQGYSFSAEAGTTAGRFVLSFRPATTDAISNVTTDDAEAATYNMAGQRVNANAKGILIQKGHKVLK